MILSAVENCVQRRLRMTMDSAKRTSWWNQDVKHAWATYTARGPNPARQGFSSGPPINFLEL